LRRPKENQGLNDLPNVLTLWKFVLRAKDTELLPARRGKKRKVEPTSGQQVNENLSRKKIL